MMHGPINVKSPNNTSKWQMGFNSAFKGLILSIVFYLPTDTEEFRFKRNIKIYIKNAPTCFGLITIIRERTI
jgi:hypothetical protein